MDYIVLDIEFNGRKFASELPMEVIEIGAVRLDESLLIVDEFTAFVKPVYFAKLNSFIQKKTGIPQEAIDSADRFPKVIGQFLKWLGRSEAPMLIAWGGEDLKRIVLDTRMHKLDDSYWLGIDYYDLLKGFLRYRGLSNDVSVEAALQDLGLSSEGSAHRALDDARMTADIFRAVFPHLDFSYVTRYKDTYTNAKERRLVKNGIRLLRSQKLAPTWDAFVEHVLKDKVKGLDDPRKAAELQSYFEAELAKKPAAPQRAAAGAAERGAGGGAHRAGGNDGPSSGGEAHRAGGDGSASSGGEAHRAGDGSASSGREARRAGGNDGASSGSEARRAGDDDGASSGSEAHRADE